MQYLVTILLLFYTTQISADLNKLFLQNLDIACQEQNLDPLLELFAIPTKIILPNGSITTIDSKEKLSQTWENLFSNSDELIEFCNTISDDSDSDFLSFADSERLEQLSRLDYTTIQSNDNGKINFLLLDVILKRPKNINFINRFINF